MELKERQQYKPCKYYPVWGLVLFGVYRDVFCSCASPTHCKSNYSMCL